MMSAKNIFSFVLIIVIFTIVSCGNKTQKALESKLEGINLLQTSKFDKAIEELNKSFKLNDKDPETIYYLGNAYFGKNDINKAFECYTKAIEIDSTFAKAYVNRGRLYFMKHDRCSSCKDWLKAEALGEKNLREDTKFCDNYK